MATFTGIIDIDAAFTVAIDIFEYHAGALHSAKCLGWDFGQTTELGDAQDEQLVIALFRYSGSPTSGSSGTTPTMRGSDAQGMTSFGTLETGNTTQMSGGTSEEVRRWTWKVLQKALYVPLPGEEIQCGAGEYLVLRILGNPADSIGGTNGIAGTVSFFEN